MKIVLRILWGIMAENRLGKACFEWFLEFILKTRVVVVRIFRKEKEPNWLLKNMTFDY